MGSGDPVTIWIADLSTAAFRRTDDHFLVGMNDLMNCNCLVRISKTRQPGLLQLTGNRVGRDPKRPKLDPEQTIPSRHVNAFLGNPTETILELPLRTYFHEMEILSLLLKCFLSRLMVDGNQGKCIVMHP